jgi:hypothetical protein
MKDCAPDFYREEVNREESGLIEKILRLCSLATKIADNPEEATREDLDSLSDLGYDVARGLQTRLTILLYYLIRRPRAAAWLYEGIYFSKRMAFKQYSIHRSTGE